MWNLFCLTSITTQSTSLCQGREYTWGDTNIWEAYFTSENHLNESNLFMSLVTFCRASISITELTRVVLWTVLCDLRVAEVASACLCDTSSLLFYRLRSQIFDILEIAIFIWSLTLTAFFFNSQWTMLILSFQWKSMEQFTRYVLTLSFTVFLCRPIHITDMLKSIMEVIVKAPKI